MHIIAMGVYIVGGALVAGGTLVLIFGMAHELGF